MYFTLSSTGQIIDFSHPEVSVVKEMFVPVRGLSLEQLGLVSSLFSIFSYLGYAVFLYSASAWYFGTNPVVSPFGVTE